MTGEHTDKHLAEAVESEYDNCVKNHGGFKNYHEAYSVLKEEAEEVAEAFTVFTNTKKESMYVLWRMIRKDDMEGADEHIEAIYDIAEELVKEGIQVMAVCRKWNDLLAKENE